MLHESLLQYSKVFSELIKLTNPSLDTTNLCFELVDLVAQKFLGKYEIMIIFFYSINLTNKHFLRIFEKNYQCFKISFNHI